MIPHQGEKGDYTKGTGMPDCNDPRLSASRNLYPGGVAIASLGDGSLPVVQPTAPPPLPVAPPIVGTPATALGAMQTRFQAVKCLRPSRRCASLAATQMEVLTQKNPSTGGEFLL